MTDEELLRRLGEEVLGWTFSEETSGHLPSPPDSLLDALEGRRGPVFWRIDSPDRKPQFFVAEPGPRATPWNPIEDQPQRERLLAKLTTLGGRVSVHDHGITVERVDGFRFSTTGSSPRQICEAALAALSRDVEEG